MEQECPFCWSRYVKPVGPPPKERSAALNAHLMACEECERWYWAERQEEVAALFMSCQTTILQPERCDADVREIASSLEPGRHKRRFAELNHVCAGCSNGCFLPSPQAPEPRIRAPFHDYGYSVSRSLEP
jgi:hypothetical protein